MELELVAFESTQIEQDVSASEGVIDVFCWRLEELKRAGYQDMMAGRLAENLQIDLHAACRLLERGCDEDTAYRILL